MALWQTLGMGVAGAAASAGLLIGAPHQIDTSVAAPDRHHLAPELVEDSHCGGAPVTTDPPAPAAGGGSPGEAVQTITVTVPRTAIVAVDDLGRIVSASTNTGCAPQVGDDLYYRHPDGGLTQAPTDELAGLRWVGDFTQRGVQHPQP